MRYSDHTTAAKPSDASVFQALLLIASTLGQRYAYWHRGRYHFALADDWSIAVSPESAGRFRVEACRYTEPVDTLWTLADDRERLAGLVVDVRDAIGRLATTGETTHG